MDYLLLLILFLFFVAFFVHAMEKHRRELIRLQEKQRLKDIENKKFFDQTVNGCSTDNVIILR